jgi:hypothetical protein
MVQLCAGHGLDAETDADRKWKRSLYDAGIAWCWEQGRRTGVSDVEWRQRVGTLGARGGRSVGGMKSLLACLEWAKKCKCNDIFVHCTPSDFVKLTTVQSQEPHLIFELVASITSHVTSPPRTTPNILPKSIPANLLPLDFLPRNRQLSPQALERTLTQLRKRSVQVFLVFLLRSRNLPHDILLAHIAQADLLLGKQAHVAVFVVVHVDVDDAGERAG